MLYNTSAQNTRARGRRGALQETRDLISLLGSLSHEGDTIDVHVISQRMGIPPKEAEKLLTILQTVGVDNNTPLTVYSDADGKLTVAFERGIHGTPLRLNKTETVALNAALNYLHVPADDSLRTKINHSYGARSVNLQDVMRAIYPSDSPVIRSSLSVISKAIATNKVIHLSYKGTKDKTPRMRTILPMYLQRNDISWFLKGMDLDIGSTRTFRLDRITDCNIAEYSDIAGITKDVSIHEVDGIHHKKESMLATNSSSERLVELTFFDEEPLRRFNWPGITFIRKQDGCITATIPYYGDSSPWLPRQLAACAGKVKCEDTKIVSLVREYAARLLDLAQSANSD